MISMQGLGERVGIAGLVLFTVGAVLFGTVGCKAPGEPTSPGRATCDEPATWCGGEAVRR